MGAMKKINVMVVLAAAVAALVSCNKEKDLVPAQNGDGIQICVTASMPDTRTVLADDGKNVNWTTSDKVGFINGEANVNVESSAAVLDGEGRATFTGTVTSEGTYYAYYPYFNDATYAPTADGVTVRVPNTQHPSLTSFDPAADLLVSEAFEVSASGSYSTNPTALRFRRLGAFLKVRFVDNTSKGKLTGKYAASVSVQGENNLVGRFRISGTEGLVNQNSGYKKVTAEYESETFTVTSSNAWFGVVPQTFAAESNLIVTLTIDENVITKTLTMPKDVELGAGDILPIKVTFTDSDFPRELKIEKLWEKLSTADANWLASIGGTAGSDFNIAIDNENVYVPEFGGSKKLWAIDIATGNTVSNVNTSTVQSVGFDGSIFLSCARVVKKNDGTPVLMATNLFSDADSENPTGRLYIWDNGVDQEPTVKTLQQWGAGRRLGDTWTTYGNYEDCWMIMGTQTGNGFVTFRVPTGSTSYLTSRLAIETANFCSFYPFPGELTKGMFSWRGGDHDDGMAYRNRLMTIDSTEEAIKSEGAHTSTLSKLTTWMGNYENNNGSGFNYFEFNGKRYVAWVINMADNKTFDVVVKEGDATASWDSIINTPAADITSAGGFAFRESLVGGQATTWKQGTDCAVWNNGDEVYIAVNKINVGIAVYKMYMADAE